MTISLNSEVPSILGSFFEIILGPAFSYVHMLGNLKSVVEVDQKVSEEVVSNFTEKGSNYHIEFLQHGLLVPASQDSFYDYYHDEHLKGQTSSTSIGTNATSPTMYMKI